MVRVTRSKSVNKDSVELHDNDKEENQFNACESDRLVRILEFPGVSNITFSLSEANTAKIGSLLNLSFDSAESNLKITEDSTVFTMLFITLK